MGQTFLSAIESMSGGIPDPVGQAFLPAIESMSGGHFCPPELIRIRSARQ
jgi:hypothetical protein